MKITEVALKFRPSVYVFILLIILSGISAYRSMPLEAAPDIEIPIVLVSTVYPGVAPSDMETLVTNILERELKQLKNVKKLTSTSAESVSVINIEFESGLDMDDAYQKVRDKVDKAKPDLPPEAEDPELIEINISEFPIMLINVYGKQDLVRLKQIAEDISEQIEQVPGVLNVDVTGGRERQIQVLLDPKKMEHHKIGVGDVIFRIREENLNMPGGNLELNNSKYLVRLTGEYKNVALMEDLVIKAPDGYPIKLRDIGRVVDGFEDRESISRVNGQECVTLRVQKRSGENLVRIADDIHKILEDVKTNLPTGVGTLVRQDESEYIRMTVSDLENSVITGLLLVLLVLLFFMGLRNAAFVAIAIPLSLLLTMSILSTLGITLNMVVLFSLILALGMLVDNSIVVVENIFRHASDGTHRFIAAYEGTKEVAWPIITSTATTVAVFIPVMFWPGIFGDFMVYLPITVIVALLSSLFVALVINPVIAAGFLRSGQKLFDDSGEVRGRLMRLYKTTLVWSLKHPKINVLIAALTFIVSIVLFSVLGSGVEFFPTITPDRAQVRINAPRGTVLEKTNQLALKVESIAAEQKDIDDLVTNVGFGGGNIVVGGGGGNSHSSVVDLEFKDRDERQGSSWDSVAKIRKELAALSGGEYQIETEEMGPPAGAPVAVEVAGPDYQVLQEQARRVKKLLSTVDGVVDIKDDYDAGSPEIRVTVDREKAKIRKVSTIAIAQAIATAINGTKASVLREGEDEYDIVVRYDLPYRTSINDLKDIRITGEEDVQIPLSDVAVIETSAGLGSINHIDRKRTISVTADVTGRSSSEVLLDVKKRAEKELQMPNNYRLHYAGESEEQDKASAFLSKAFGIGLLIIAIILITQFNSVLRPGIIMASIIMSLIGVLLGLVLTGNKFGILMSGMGVISLAGVVINNAIVLIDYINQLREKQGMSLTDALIKAGLVRFRPVIMTAVTTILGMLPMALGISIDFATGSIDIGSQSSEWWGPMAQAIIFGLLCATVMTLILVPVMYLLQVRFTEKSLRWFRRIFRIRSEPAPPPAPGVHS